MSDINYFTSKISFRFFQPGQPLPKGYFRTEKLLNKNGIYIDLFNTRLPAGNDKVNKKLKEICRIPRMSSIAMAAIINETVSKMSSSLAFVNIGVWHGFSLIAGMVNNPDKKCIGIDNFSMWGGPKQSFINNFDKFKSPNHFFYEMDYEKYFETVHRDPIGFYFYDGNHDYKHQLKGLQVAEKYFAKNCLILVDDTNWGDPRQATIDFIAANPGNYKVIMDKKTAPNRQSLSLSSCHPTFWNGFILFQKIS